MTHRITRLKFMRYTCGTTIQAASRDHERRGARFASAQQPRGGGLGSWCGCRHAHRHGLKVCVWE
eukprot:39170-Chlamydomonas_euryale.AAC.2